MFVDHLSHVLQNHVYCFREDLTMFSYENLCDRSVADKTFRPPSIFLFPRTVDSVDLIRSSNLRRPELVNGREDNFKSSSTVYFASSDDWAARTCVKERLWLRFNIRDGFPAVDETRCYSLTHCSQYAPQRCGGIPYR